jgi:hypothetical protein
MCADGFRTTYRQMVEYKDIICLYEIKLPNNSEIITVTFLEFSLGHLKTIITQ